MTPDPHDTVAVLKDAQAGADWRRRLRVMSVVARRRVGRRWRGILFWAWIALSGLIVSIALWTAVGSNTDAETARDWPLTLLVLNVPIMLAPAGVVAWRLSRNAAQGGFEGARLHSRFAVLFSAIVAAPTIVLALLFFLLYDQGVERWFEPRIQSLVDVSRSAAAVWLEEEAQRISRETQLMASDLGQPDTMQGMEQAPDTFRTYLANQAAIRGFAAAYVLDETGLPLAIAEAPGAPDFRRPGRVDFVDVDEGDLFIRTFEEDEVIRALFKLPNVENRYVMAVEQYPPGTLSQLQSAVTASRDFLAITMEQDRIFYLLAFGFLEAALLAVIAASALGLQAANDLARPIGRLASAAERVSAGDYQVRVALPKRADEVGDLASAFNRMTAQLAGQNKALVEARRTAEAHSQFMGAVLSGVGAGVVSLDDERRVTLANPAALSLFQMDAEELVGRRFDAAAPEFGPSLDQAERGVLDIDHRIELERDGVETVLRARVSRSEGPHGGRGFVVTFDDMSSAVLAQRQAAWRDVARRVAHEIRNPLTPIQLSAERLKRRFAKLIGEEEGRGVFDQCVDAILRQVADIGRMVDEFAAFARMPAARREQADLLEIVRRSVFDQRIRTSDIKVEFDDPGREIVLDLDERLVGQALTNVLKNAGEAIGRRKDAEPDFADPRIRVALERDDSELRLLVIDNGVGLPARGRERLVEPYVTTRDEGAGLGLAIVSRILEDHGGRLELTDAPGVADGSARGAMVRLIFPSAAGQGALGAPRAASSQQA